MYGTGFGIHDCDPISRAHSYQQDMLREAAQLRHQVQATKDVSTESKQRRGLVVRLTQLVRASRTRQVASAH